MDAVDLTGYVSSETFAHYLTAADVAVNLRYPCSGESSDTLIRLLGAGVPTLVSAVGAFHKLPDDVVLKIPADDGELDGVEQALRALWRDREWACRIAEAARIFVKETADPVKVAKQYVTFVQQLI